MKKQIRYKHRVSWIESGKLKTSWFSSHKKADEEYDLHFMKGEPVYYARKISDTLSAYQFDRVRSENDFGKALIAVNKND